MKKPAILSLVLAVVVIAVMSGCAPKDTSFSFSNGINNDGHWKGVKALKYVTLCDYNEISIPSDVHSIPDDAIQSEIDSIMADYTTEEQVTDRAIVDGDTVNIDYVGSIDGVAFDGGSTQGQGTEVTIGVTQYIDDFLEQLIGHIPGESFDVNVTFPEEYGVDNLNGKDAVFAVTVNYIVNAVTPELTDDFVTENLSDAHGWNTVTEMKSGIESDLQRSAVEDYVQGYILQNSTVSKLPQSLITYEENVILNSYQDYADQYQMSLDEFFNEYMNGATTDQLLEQYRDNNTQTATLNLILQAVAEDAGFSVNDDDVAVFFAKQMGAEDYSTFEETYGMPYLKMAVLQHTVITYLADNAVME